MARTSPTHVRTARRIGPERLVIPFPERTRGLDPSPFQPPLPRPGDVLRRDLVGRLVGSDETPLVVVSAPAGYGKTALFAQWALADPRCFAWLRVDPSHDDPTLLRTNLFLAAGAAEARGGGPSVLVLDDAHRLQAPATLQIVSSLVDGLPSGSQVALACRDLPGLPLGRLRAERRLLQLGAEDLALNDDGAAALLRAAGVELDPADVALLVRRAEGWPAALSLAAGSLGGRR